MVFEMGYKLNAQELELAVKKLDQHGGGIVYADFAQWWKSDQRFAHLQLSEEELAKLQKAQTYFNHFDKDRSGVLSVQGLCMIWASRQSSFGLNLIKSPFRIQAIAC